MFIVQMVRVLHWSCLSSWHLLLRRSRPCDFSTITAQVLTTEKPPLSVSGKGSCRGVIRMHVTLPAMSFGGSTCSRCQVCDRCFCLICVLGHYL